MEEKKDSLVNPYGKIFIGGGLEVEMAVYNEKNPDGLQDVILKLTGAPAYDAGIDGKAIKYFALPAGTGVDFQYEKDGTKKTRMLTRQSWGTWTFFEVFLNGKTIKVQLDEKESKRARPLHLLSALD